MGDLPTHQAPPDDVLPPDRLFALMENVDWCRWASAEVSSLTDHNRNVVARWAPLMMAAEQPRDLLDAFAALNDELFALSILLRRLADRRAVDASLKSHWVLGELRMRRRGC